MACFDGLSCSSCSGISAFLSRGRRADLADDFSQRVDFLASVPFLQAQLPLAEMPRVAGRVRLRKWPPGASVVREGKVADGFYVVYGGEADVITTRHESSSSSVRVVTLSRGDTFGGRSHIRHMKADFTVKAGGLAGLTTLALTRKDLDELGLSTKLKFPKRAGMYEGVFGRDMHHQDIDGREGLSGSKDTLPSMGSMKHFHLTDQEQAFISSALKQVPNLRALVSTDDEWASRLASLFTRREVAAGEEIATADEPGKEFFVLAKGSLGVFSRKPRKAGMSAEAMVHAEKITWLMQRRYQFLQELSHSSRTSSRLGHATSVDLSSTRAAPSTGLDSLPVKEVHRRRKTMGQLAEENGGALTRPDTESEPPPDAIVKEGEAFGELSALYNVKYLATARALQDCVLYVLPRHLFKTLRCDSPKLEEYCKLLDEVQLLLPLIQSERRCPEARSDQRPRACPGGP